jgi:hypothetical protein
VIVARHGRVPHPSVGRYIPHPEPQGFHMN